MNIVFLGNPDFEVGELDALILSDFFSGDYFYSEAGMSVCPCLLITEISWGFSHSKCDYCRRTGDRSDHHADGCRRGYR